MQSTVLSRFTAAPDNARRADLALVLRIGLGIVFVSGGIAKLRRLLDPSLADGIVSQYMGPLGYINETFQQLLFSGALSGFVTPWSFLTLLSGFELVSGILLIAGIFVRPLALIYALLLWSFIFSLPVVTTPGVVVEETTYSSPALLVQVRDVTLSGLFVALYLLGAGSRSLDASVYGLPASRDVSWDTVGPLIRYALALAFIVGGVFHGFHKIPTYETPSLILVIIGIGLAAGVGTRLFAAAAAVVLFVFMAGKLPEAAGVIGFFNAVKREFAMLAAAGVIVVAGGGRAFTILSIAQDIATGVRRYTRVGKPAQPATG